MAKNRKLLWQHLQFLKVDKCPTQKTFTNECMCKLEDILYLPLLNNIYFYQNWISCGVKHRPITDPEEFQKQLEAWKYMYLVSGFETEVGDVKTRHTNDECNNRSEETTDTLTLTDTVWDEIVAENQIREVIGISEQNREGGSKAIAGNDLELKNKERVDKEITSNISELQNQKGVSKEHAKNITDLQNPDENNEYDQNETINDDTEITDEPSCIENNMFDDKTTSKNSNNCNLPNSESGPSNNRKESYETLFEKLINPRKRKVTNESDVSFKKKLDVDLNLSLANGQAVSSSSGGNYQNKNINNTDNTIDADINSSINKTDNNPNRNSSKINANPTSDINKNEAYLNNTVNIDRSVHKTDVTTNNVDSNLGITTNSNQDTHVSSSTSILKVDANSNILFKNNQTINSSSVVYEHSISKTTTFLNKCSTTSTKNVNVDDANILSTSADLINNNSSPFLSSIVNNLVGDKKSTSITTSDNSDSSIANKTYNNNSSMLKTPVSTKGENSTSKLVERECENDTNKPARSESTFFSIFDRLIAPSTNKISVKTNLETDLNQNKDRNKLENNEMTKKTSTKQQFQSSSSKTQEVNTPSTSLNQISNATYATPCPKPKENNQETSFFSMFDKLIAPSTRKTQSAKTNINQNEIKTAGSVKSSSRNEQIENINKPSSSKNNELSKPATSKNETFGKSNEEIVTSSIENEVKVDTVKNRKSVFDSVIERLMNAKEAVVESSESETENTIVIEPITDWDTEMNDMTLDHLLLRQNDIKNERNDVGKKRHNNEENIFNSTFMGKNTSSYDDSEMTQFTQDVLF